MLLFSNRTPILNKPYQLKMMQITTTSKRRSDMNPDTLAHLQFIQDVIDRMNRNSFQLKEWCIAIVSAFLALYASNSNHLYLFVAILPVIIFWCLDAYYLQQERKFRGVYNDVVSENGKVPPFQMPINRYKGGKYAFWNVWRSRTLAMFYGLLIVSLVGVFILQRAGENPQDAQVETQGEAVDQPHPAFVAPM